MIINVDCDLDQDGNIFAYHSINTDDFSQNIVQDPSLPGVKVDIQTYLKYMQNNKSKLASQGWLEITKLPDFPPGTTRWEVLVQTINESKTDTALKSLGLM